jgi:NADH dehydrogenase FAD-containing subunit
MRPKKQAAANRPLDALAANSPALKDSSASLLPPLTDIRRVATQIAVAVSIEAQKDGLTPKLTEEELRQRVTPAQWTPDSESNIVVCGDLAAVTENGRRIPAVAQPAMQMGAHAAKMIAADLQGKLRTPFHYFDKGDMATIGRGDPLGVWLLPLTALMHRSRFLPRFLGVWLPSSKCHDFRLILLWVTN